jgi:SAM-dependent methyltransferase
MLVLDAGAGRSPYRHLFRHAHYEAADFNQQKSRYGPLDYVCDLTEIPVEDDRYDRILFNQVLEHLPDPPAAVAELYRVLKPGGRLFCSAPLFYAEHQTPHDYYRYTRFGLRRIFEDAGFEVVRLRPLEGYFGTVSYQFQMMGRQLPSPGDARFRPGWRGLYLWPLLLALRVAAPSLARTFARLEVNHPRTGGGMPKNYVIVVRKPHPDGQPATASG